MEEKMSAKILSIVLLVAGCSTPGIKDVTISNTTNKFEQEFNLNVTTDFIIKDKFKGTIGAKCLPGLNVILVNKVFWERFPEGVKEAVIFRELARCNLGVPYTVLPLFMSKYMGHTYNSYRYFYEDLVEDLRRNRVN